MHQMVFLKIKVEFFKRILSENFYWHPFYSTAFTTMVFYIQLFYSFTLLCNFTKQIKNILVDKYVLTFLMLNLDAHFLIIIFKFCSLEFFVVPLKTQLTWLFQRLEPSKNTVS